MPLLHGKQLQNTSVNLNKLTGTGSLILQTGATFQVPTANILTATDIVNKQYVDDLAVGLNPHASVRTITIGNINLTTATVSPVQSGYTMSTGDRILVWQQSITASNGIYVYNGTTFSRAADMDGSPTQEISVGIYTFVTAGTYSGYGYTIVSSGTYSGVLEPIDVAPIVWSQFTGPASYVWGNGINMSANIIDIDLAPGSGLTFSGGQLTLNPTVAGNGLGIGSGVLSVNTANGLQIVADNVEIAPSVAGTGLSFSGGVLNIRNTAVTANSYGDAATVPTVTFNAQGQAIAATAVSISITSGQVNNFTSSVSGLVKAGTGITVVSTGGGATVSLTAIGDTTSLGSANTVNTFTYNNYGQITTSATVSIAIPSGQITNFTASVNSVASITSGQVTNFTASVNTLINSATAGTPVYNQRSVTSANTTGNLASTGITLANTPNDGATVMVYVNGQLQYLGDGTSSNVDCFFGTTSSVAKSIVALTSGDQLYWNGTYVGFDLSTTDKIDLIYNK